MTQEMADMTAKMKEMNEQTKLTRLMNNLLPQKMAQETLDMKEMNEPNINFCHCNPCMAKEMPKLTELNKLLSQEMAEEMQSMKELNHNLYQ